MQKILNYQDSYVKYLLHALNLNDPESKIYRRINAVIDAILLHIIAIPVYIVILITGIKKKISIHKQIIIFLFFIYFIGVLSVTLFPLPVQKELLIYRRELSYVTNNFIPFATIKEIIDQRNIKSGTLIANIILFIPLGSFLPLLWQRVSKLSIVFLWGFVGSISVEFLQYLISLLIGYTYRSTDIDDVILNIIGAVIGFSMLKLSLPVTGKHLE
jgi:glycopeptide antibiotics resistance protein